MSLNKADIWHNPLIKCEVNANQNVIRKYASQKFTIAESFAEFCSRMQKHFNEANLSVLEAEKIYALLEKSKQISDQPSGSPSPDLQQVHSLKLQELKTRVAIKKVSEGIFEIYYNYFGCGINYIHNRLILKGNEIDKVESMEVWGGKSPC